MKQFIEVESIEGMKYLVNTDCIESIYKDEHGVANVYFWSDESELHLKTSYEEVKAMLVE